jgi:hypothetical protein
MQKVRLALKVPQDRSRRLAVRLADVRPFLFSRLILTRLQGSRVFFCCLGLADSA